MNWIIADVASVIWTAVLICLWWLVFDDWVHAILAHLVAGIVFQNGRIIRDHMDRAERNNIK